VASLLTKELHFMKQFHSGVVLRASLACLVTLVVLGTAQAGVILVPSTTTSDQAAQFGTATGNVVNQSGLSIAYTPGVTDFDSYLALGPTHDGGPVANVWLFDGVNANFDMDFGTAVTLDAIAIWNKNDVFGTSGFNLLAADNAAFLGAVNLVSSSLALQPTPTPFERFDFATTTNRFFRIQILDNHGASFTGLGEVAFSAAQVPEPSSMALIGVGLAFGALVRRARRAKH
jgi:hypothetical protein